ncbi:hypothetical protein LXL04_016334 [Taraxacum kok-saghyz]
MEADREEGCNVLFVWKPMEKKGAMSVEVAVESLAGSERAVWRRRIWKPIEKKGAMSVKKAVGKRKPVEVAGKPLLLDMNRSRGLLLDMNRSRGWYCRTRPRDLVGSLSTSMKFGKDCSFLSISGSLFHIYTSIALLQSKVYDWRRNKVIFIFDLIKSNLAVFPANAAVSERTESLLSLHSDSLQPLTPAVFYSVSPVRSPLSSVLLPFCFSGFVYRLSVADGNEGNFETTYSSNAMPALKKTEPGDIRQLFERFDEGDRRTYIYLTKKVKKRVREEDDGIFCSCTSTPGSSAACGRDCHCGMLLSSCSSNCKCDNSCLNKPFHRRPMKKMKIVQTEKCGSGVVAEENIRHGEFIIEYVGEVIDDKTCEERLWRMKRQGETNFYLCEINRDMVIDATFKGNQSRYINHSCSPNTEMQKWRIDGETRIGIFATRNIKKGEHLTYDYQFVQFGADQDCHCGAKGCRQKLGAKPNKSKFPSSDAALKIVACQVAINSPKVKALLDKLGNCIVLIKSLTCYIRDIYI